MLKSLLVIPLLISFAAFPTSPVRAEMTSEQRQEFEEVIREYLIANPEVIEDVLDVLREKQAAEVAAAQAAAIADNRDILFDSAHQIVLGNPEGAITLVEFFDYNCRYCARAVADMTALISANPDLRVVLKELPILSEGSVAAARISIAVKDVAPQLYLQFHQDLFARPGEATGQKALEIVRDLGLAEDAIRTAAEREEVTGNLEEVKRLAELLRISGTPSYVIGDELVYGAAGYDALQEKVAAMRECGSTACDAAQP